MKVSGIKFLAPLAIVASTALFACAGSAPSMPAVGQAVPADTLKQLMPKYDKGTKWTYATTTTGASSAATEMTQEVTEVNGDKVTLKVTSGSSSNTATIDLTQGNPMAGFGSTPTGGYVSAGNEDVKVPAGEYKGAAKLTVTPAAGSSSATTKVTMWLAKDVGMVKATSETTSGSTTLTTTIELKEYKKP